MIPQILRDNLQSGLQDVSTCMANFLMSIYNYKQREYPFGQSSKQFTMTNFHCLELALWKSLECSRLKENVFEILPI